MTVNVGISVSFEPGWEVGRSGVDCFSLSLTINYLYSEMDV